MDIDPVMMARIEALPLSDVRKLAAQELHRQQRVRDAQVGRTLSPESRRKIGDSQRRRWAQRRQEQAEETTAYALTRLEAAMTH